MFIVGCAKTHCIPGMTHSSISSTDGTDIAYGRTGQGPPLVLVHGTTGHHKEWREVVPRLSEDFTVHAMDRRGRGGSGDTDEYAIEREYEDVAAVVDHVAAGHDPEAPVSLVGHSYGVICSLHAILETDTVDRLVLYEPPLGDVPADEGAAAELEGVLERQGPEAALEMFLRHFVGLTDAEINEMRGDGLWDGLVDAMPTVPREVRATRRDLSDLGTFRDVSVDATLLVGSESPPPIAEAARTVKDALDGQIITLPGQEHMAMHEAPEVFLEALMEALEGKGN